MPVMLVIRVFLSNVMAVFRQYKTDDDLSWMPALLRKYASTIGNYGGKKNSYRERIKGAVRGNSDNEVGTRASAGIISG